MDGTGRRKSSVASTSSHSISRSISVSDAALGGAGMESRRNSVRPMLKQQRSFSVEPNEEERQRLLQTFRSTDVYTRRWYILTLCSLVIALEGCVWNTWGPISSPAQQALQWSDATIALLANWGCIGYLVAAIPMSYLLDSKGLRVSMLVGSGLQVIATGLRCITSSLPAASWLINAGHIFNGLSSPIMFGSPPIISAVWFPVEQRTIATAIGAMAGYLGIALSFVVGPQLVPDVNCTAAAEGEGWSDYYTSSLGKNDSGAYQHCIDETTGRIMHLLYGEGALAAALFILIIVYFPAKPPLPPSLSSSGSRLDFVQGLKRLAKKPVYWVVAFTYGVSTGVYSGWGAVLDINLGRFDVSQNHAGWIGFYSTVAGAVGGLLIAKVADYYAGKLRQLLILLFALSTLVFTWFSLTGLKVVSEDFSIRQISFYISAILGGIFLNSTVPLFYEMAAERAFPVAEGVAAVIITMLNNVFSVAFLLCLMIPHIGVMWINWVLVASCAVSVPLLAVLRDKYVRMALDTVAADRPSSTGGPSPGPSPGPGSGAQKKKVLARRHTSGVPLVADGGGFSRDRPSSHRKLIQGDDIAEE